MTTHTFYVTDPNTNRRHRVTLHDYRPEGAHIRFAGQADSGSVPEQYDHQDYRYSHGGRLYQLAIDRAWEILGSEPYNS